MATMKFEVGKVYITMQDKFGDGEQTGKSAVIERTEGTVTFKHLASGEIFVREISVFEMADVEGCDGYEDMDNFIADNFGEEIGTAEIESVEPVAEIYTVRRTGKYGDRSNFEYDNYETALNSAKNDIADGSFVSVEIYKNHDYSKAYFEWDIDSAKIDIKIKSAESAVESTENTAKVEICKGYDAKDIIAACYPVELENRTVEEVSENAMTEKELIEKIVANGYRPIVCGVADKRKGLEDFLKLTEVVNAAKAEIEKMEDTPAEIPDDKEKPKEPTIFDKAKLIDELKAKVAEQRARPRKSIIDWAGTFEEMRITELFDLQKDFKKHLKLGEVELAENVFSMLKTLCRNYRAAA